MPLPTLVRRHEHRLLGAAIAVIALSACTPSPEEGSTEPSVGPITTTQPSLTPNFSLLIHCGVRYAVFQSLNWEAEPPIPEIPAAVTDSPDRAHGRYFIEGRKVRVSRDQAVFTSVEDPVGTTVRFRLRAEAVPGCA